MTTENLNWFQKRVIENNELKPEIVDLYKEKAEDQKKEKIVNEILDEIKKEDKESIDRIWWVEEKGLDEWKSIKKYTKKILSDGDPVSEEVNWIFNAHNRDTIKGKPQLVENIQKRIC